MKFKRISETAGTIKGSSSDEFDKVMLTVFDWLTHKTKFQFSNDHRTGSPFEKKSDKATVEAIKIDGNADSFLWMLRYSHPCGQRQDRNWHTEIAIGKNNGSFLFGVRLLASSPDGYFFDITPSSPTLIKELINKHDIMIDGTKALTKAKMIDSEDAADSMIDLINSSRRKKPVIVIAKKRHGYAYPLNAERFAQKLAGIAHVYCMSTEACHALDNLLGQDVSVQDGGIRFYLPGIDVFNPELRLMPVFHRHLFQGGQPFEPFLTIKAFDSATRVSLDDGELPSFAKAKAIFLQKQEIQKEKTEKETSVSAPSDNFNEMAKLHKTIEELRRQIPALREEVDFAYSVASEEEELRQKISAENEELKEQLQDFETEAAELSNPYKGQSGIFPPLSLVEEWSKYYYPDRLALSPRAVKEAIDPKYSVYRDPGMIFQCLGVLGKENWDKTFLDQDVNHAYERKLRSIGVEDRFSIKAGNQGQFGETYYASWEGQKYFLDRHLTKGNSRRPQGCLRIYYTHDKERMRIVVGSLPRHLKNSLT